MQEPQQEMEEPMQENTIEKPKSGRSKRSDKQIAAFEKAQAKRIENAKLKKELKKKPPTPTPVQSESESEPESEPEPEIIKKKKQKPKKKKIVYESDSSESSDSDLDEYTITRKKKTAPKQPPPVERQFAGLRFV